MSVTGETDEMDLERCKAGCCAKGVTTLGDSTFTDGDSTVGEETLRVGEVTLRVGEVILRVGEAILQRGDTIFGIGEAILCEGGTILDAEDTGAPFDVLNTLGTGEVILDVDEETLGDAAVVFGIGGTVFGIEVFGIATSGLEADQVLFEGSGGILVLTEEAFPKDDTSGNFIR